MSAELALQIETLTASLLKEQSVELVDLRILRTTNKVHIQMLVDKDKGGITLAQCSWLNKKIGDILEENNTITNPYILEVSSPGLDRPLKTKKDFLRVLGRDVRMFLAEPVEDKLEYQGVVREVYNEGVVMEIDSSTILIPLDKINKAKQII